MHPLRHELKEYYTAIRHDRIAGNQAYVRRRDEIFAAMEAFEAAHPGIHPCLLKDAAARRDCRMLRTADLPPFALFLRNGRTPRRKLGHSQRLVSRLLDAAAAQPPGAKH